MNGETFLIFTTSQGGYFQGLMNWRGEIRKFSEEDFANLKKTRQLDVGTGVYIDGIEQTESVRPTLVMLARIEENHDFVLGGPREEGRAA